MNRRIAFVNPPYERIAPGYGFVKHVTNRSPSLGLLHLAAEVRQHGWEPSIVESDIEDLDADGVVERVVALDPAYVGITLFTVGVAGSVEIARKTEAAAAGRENHRRRAAHQQHGAGDGRAVPDVRRGRAGRGREDPGQPARLLRKRRRSGRRPRRDLPPRGTGRARQPAGQDGERFGRFAVPRVGPAAGVPAPVPAGGLRLPGRAGGDDRGVAGVPVPLQVLRHLDVRCPRPLLLAGEGRRADGTPARPLRRAARPVRRRFVPGQPQADDGVL